MNEFPWGLVMLLAMFCAFPVFVVWAGKLNDWLLERLDRRYPRDAAEMIVEQQVGLRCEKCGHRL